MMLLEVEDVPNVRPSPCIDRLVRIADDEEVAVGGRDRVGDDELRLVGVLILVDQHVAESILQLVPDLAVGPQQMRGVAEQIVEVDDDRGREFALDRHAHSHNTSRFDSRLERREEKRVGRGENYAIASHRTTLPQRNRIIYGNDDFDHDSHFRARHYHRGPYSQKRYDRSPERHYERDRSMRNSTSEDTLCVTTT